MKTYPFQQARQFQKIFTRMKFQPYFDPLTGFDICKFDDDYKLVYGDYEDDETSLSDAITALFGDEASNFVRVSLLSMSGII